MKRLSDKISRLKQELETSEEKHTKQLKKFLFEKEHLIRGNFRQRGRRCGKKGCHCATGELHYSKYLDVTVGGITRHLYVPAQDELFVKEGTERYQRLRQARAELKKLHLVQLELLEALLEEMSYPYPPDNPIPPPQKRGRKQGVPQHVPAKRKRFSKK